VDNLIRSKIHPVDTPNATFRASTLSSTHSQSTSAQFGHVAIPPLFFIAIKVRASISGFLHLPSWSNQWALWIVIVFPYRVSRILVGDSWVPGLDGRALRSIVKCINDTFQLESPLLSPLRRQAVNPIEDLP
jgi:hypothetical protein